MTNSPASPIGRSAKPNVLFIVTDDQRPVGTFDVMPATRRWFHGQGTDFPNAFATTPVCGPSRASIFSGLYAHNHGVHHNQQAPNIDHRSTIQRYLQEAGYSTAIFGKYLNDWDLNRDPPFFDRWAIFNKGYSPIEVNEQGSAKRLEQYSTTYVADHAVRFIEESDRAGRRPWFLYLAPFAPHPPFIPEPRHADAPVPPFEPGAAFFPSDRSDKPAWVQEMKLEPNVIVANREAQLRTLKSVDDLVGRVFDTLQSLDKARDTLAFFVSDNGWLWGEHGLSTKGKPYTQSVGIPLIVRWPGYLKDGAADGRLVANIDLAPTVLDAIGIAADSPMDGKSLLDEGSARERLLTEFWGAVRNPQLHAPPWDSTRTPSFQYVEYYEEADKSTVTFREYYDLTNDPDQLRNVLNDAGPGDDRVPALFEQLAADRACTPGTCP